MTWILGDAHVHLRSLSRLASLARAAQWNFLAAEQALCAGERAERFLFLTESAGDSAFAHLESLAGSLPENLGIPTIHPTGEDNSLRLEMADGCGVHVVAGRQIVTRESIEVLALGLNRSYADGAPLALVLNELAQEQVLTVLPWGVGKWLGRRGKLIAEVLAGWHGDRLFLGDNGNRPFFWPLPDWFRQCGRSGFRNLPGSDPLPLPGQEERIGGYGFGCQGAIDHARPFHSVATLLRDSATAIHPYGAPAGLFRFFNNQLRLRLPGKRQS